MQKGDAAIYAEAKRETNIFREPFSRPSVIFSLYFAIKWCSFPREKTVCMPCRASEATLTESIT